MDHNLEDSLNLGSMDFDHSGVVVNQEDITLEATVDDSDIPMEFENIEQQPMLMDTGSEEIIDFIGNEFTLQGYSVQDDPIEATTSSRVESNQLNELTSQTDTMINLQFDTSSLIQSVKHEAPIQHVMQPKYFAIQAALPTTRTSNKRSDSGALTSVPRQVAIAPKPSNLAKIFAGKSSYTTGKQFAIAPRPVALVVNKSTPRPVTTKTNTVLAQVGKQYVMVPAGSGQKIKLVPTSTGVSAIQYLRASSDQAQLISTKSLSNPVMAKVIVQGQSNTDMSNQPAVITKLLSANTSAPARYVMQQKTVPICFGGNKVVLTSPTKQGMKLGKQIIAIKSKPTLLPVTSQAQASTTKKVVITSNPNQNVILKTTAPSKSKDGQVVLEGQRTQLHQINVPGKGIQYIRLITNQTPQSPKPVPKPQTPAPAFSSKTFVLTDSKGNVIQMSSEKTVSGQPPPLVITGKVAVPTKVATKPQKKFVRIAPVSAKTTQPTIQPIRSAQSLLAPITSMSETTVSLDEFNNLIDNQNNLSSAAGQTTDDLDEGRCGEDAGSGGEQEAREEEVDSKAALRALIEGAVADDDNVDDMHSMHEVEVEFERRQSPIEDENSNSLDPNDSTDRSAEQPLIVILPNSTKQQHQITQNDANGQHRILDKSKELAALVDVEAEAMPYLSPRSPPPQALTDSDMVSNELDMRPRKACNCTKSQCLKLYCDCFANGEFCNRCNCNHCHNNLENEELRQKAIRACLDRNPNAFRPKIGKSKSGGPDIIRRHNKGCNCKRSGCLKNYCECYEAKIACTSMCKCVGCRNIEETLERRRDAMRLREKLSDPMFRPPSLGQVKQPCSFMTTEVIEAVCQCLLAAAVESGEEPGEEARGEEEEEVVEEDPIRDVIEEFARCLQDIISASQATPLSMLDEGHA